MLNKRFGWPAAVLTAAVGLVIAGVIAHNIPLIVVAMLVTVVFAPLSTDQALTRDPDEGKLSIGEPDERERAIGERAAYHALFVFVGIAAIAGTALILLTKDAFLRTLGLTVNFAAMEAAMLFCLFVAYLAEYRYRASKAAFVLLATVLAVLPIAGAVWFVYDAYPAFANATA